MIDIEKWKKLNDEQKLQMCQSLSISVNTNAVSKADWELMFRFLLEKVQGEQ